jgi:glycosyltransferase involved in cell wall biosynthesis
MGMKVQPLPKDGTERLLVFTNAFPYPKLPYYGIFVETQVRHWREAGVEVDLFFINGRESKWNYLSGVVAWIWRMLCEGRRYDAIVTHHSYCCLIAAFLRPRRVPLIYQVHEGTIHFWKLNKLLVRLATKAADKVVYVSKNLPDLLGYPVRAEDIIPCGVDLNLFKPADQVAAREAIGWDASEEVIIYAAKERKYYERFEIVERATEVLEREGRKVRLFRLEGLAPDQVPVYLNAGDVLVVSSHGEGSPKIVKEALACNKPVVALRVGSVETLLGGIRSGFLAEDSVADMVLQLRKALDLKGKGSGRERMQALSSLKTSADLLQICRKTIHSRMSKRGVHPFAKPS